MYVCTYVCMYILSLFVWVNYIYIYIHTKKILKYKQRRKNSHIEYILLHSKDKKKAIIS